METEEKSKLAEDAGFRFASYYEAENATHAICDCCGKEGGDVKCQRID